MGHAGQYRKSKEEGKLGWESKKEKGMFGSMGKRVKSYIAFTPFMYRIVVYLLIPVALTAFCTWTGTYLGDMGLVLAVMLLTLVEVVSDSWLFGGLQARDSEKIDYLKTSGRGMAVMRNALGLDLLRKFLTALCVIVASYCFVQQAKKGLERMPGAGADFISCGGAFEEIGFLLYLILLSYSLSALGTFLSRYNSTTYGNVLIGYGAMILAGLAGLFLPGLVKYPSGGIFLLDLLCVAAGIGASILAVRAAMKKVEGGYYDE